MRILAQERAWVVLETVPFHAEGLLCAERLAVTPNSSDLEKPCSSGPELGSPGLGEAELL